MSYTHDMLIYHRYSSCLTPLPYPTAWLPCQQTQQQQQHPTVSASSLRELPIECYEWACWLMSETLAVQLIHACMHATRGTSPVPEAGAFQGQHQSAALTWGKGLHTTPPSSLSMRYGLCVTPSPPLTMGRGLMGC